MTLDNDELQANNADDNLNSTIEGGNVDENSDSATGNEEENQPKKVEFDDDQQAKVNDIVGKSVKQFREEQRKNSDLQRQLDEANAKIPVEQRPVLPELPDDPFDDNYKPIVEKREKILVEQARFDERKAVANQQTQEAERQQHEEGRRKVIEVVTTYSENAKKMGMTKQQTQESMGTIATFGMDKNLLMHIVKDDMGPAISQHLIANPLALDAMRGMSATEAAVHIATVIKPSLSSKKFTNTPVPPTEIEGGGSPPTGRGPKGATYD